MAKSTKAAAKKKAAARSAKKAPARRSSKQASDPFIDRQRSLLEQERTDLLRHADLLRAEAESLAIDLEGDVQFDEESGEGATVNVERERDLALSAQARRHVHEIDLALTRMDDGTYGVCVQCGKKIPKERLKALPSAALCVTCKSGGFSDF